MKIRKGNIYMKHSSMDDTRATNESDIIRLYLNSYMKLNTDIRYLNSRTDTYIYKYVFKF